MKLIDLTGNSFGRLTVLHRDFSNTSKKVYWICLCQCGNKKPVQGSHLRRGAVCSCGCYGEETRISNQYKVKHGLTGTPEHNIWMDMQRRCYSLSNNAYQS